MKAFVFDTETSGLVNNRLVPLAKQPEILELYGAVVDLDTGEIEGEIDELFRPVLPVQWEPIPKLKEKGITKITGLTYDDVKDKPRFREKLDQLLELLNSCTAVVAHNLSFDSDMVELEGERICVDYGEDYSDKIVWPARKICTVEQTVHLTGGRLTLTKLHEHLFGEPFKDAHRARVDTQALIRCAVELRKRGAL